MDLDSLEQETVIDLRGKLQLDIVETQFTNRPNS